MLVAKFKEAFCASTITNKIRAFYEKASLLNCNDRVGGAVFRILWLNNTAGTRASISSSGGFAKSGVDSTATITQ
jgi:hypothetical protein